ncbi:EF-hand domain-containing protein [Luteimonas viscosa]|uniref:EF-hand domain-containing protein n=2 Tax=Luteimonas viscosa TaxID=1132694 RepID=A0A5D4XSS0_9GAMM|nr:EF-hand domain-containing protein [Luteimonas viscosa]
MKIARKPLFGMIALGAALAMPMAFAQEATTPAPQDPTAPTAPTTTAPTTAPTQSTAPATEQQPLTWADVDVDGSGTLSKTEAAAVPALAQVFDDADADSNGELTPDEYKAFAAQAAPQQPDASGGAD